MTRLGVLNRLLGRVGLVLLHIEYYEPGHGRCMGSGYALMTRRHLRVKLRYHAAVERRDAALRYYRHPEQFDC